MPLLSDEQLSFLARHGISEDEVLDASGMPNKAWKAEMKAKGMRVAVGVTPCQKGGHQIRARSGHCVVCNPAQLAFNSRAYKPGRIYLLESGSKDLLKVGVTTDMYGRLANLNSQRYAGASDWRILAKSNVLKAAGRLEKSIQDLLERHRVHGLSSDGSRDFQPSRECFRCPKSVALDAFNRVLGGA